MAGSFGLNASAIERKRDSIVPGSRRFEGRGHDLFLLLRVLISVTMLTSVLYKHALNHVIAHRS
eukprot:825833-Rhodomonas_salina.3